MEDMALEICYEKRASSNLPPHFQLCFGIVANYWVWIFGMASRSLLQTPLYASRITRHTLVYLLAHSSRTDMNAYFFHLFYPLFILTRITNNAVVRTFIGVLVHTLPHLFIDLLGKLCVLPLWEPWLPILLYDKMGRHGCYRGSLSYNSNVELVYCRMDEGWLAFLWPMCGDSLGLISCILPLV